MSMNVKRDFPLLQKNDNLIYFDSASTTQKPYAVINAVNDFYTTINANIHRATYALAEQSTLAYEHARAIVGCFIHARAVSEVVFTKGTTEGINAVATMLDYINFVKPGDTIVVTELEHHSNILPWQWLAQRCSATLNVIPINPDGTLRMELLPDMITNRTKIVAVTYVSNALGTKVDINLIMQHARSVGALVLIDAAQAAPYFPIDIQKIAPDFLVFSGHKMCGPTGIGVLYIKESLHAMLQPYQLGGGMVLQATAHQASWLPAPHKFEAGTPPIAQAIGLAAAITYLQQEQVDFKALQLHTASLCARFIDGVSSLPYIRLLGPIEQLRVDGHLVSFTVADMHGHDVAAYLDRYGICVRAGHHCAQPLALALGVDALVRVSFYIYNSLDDVDRLIEALHILGNEKKQLA